MRTWNFTHAQAARERSMRAKASRSLRRQRKAASNAAPAPLDDPEEAQQSSLAAARRSLLANLLAEGAESEQKAHPELGSGAVSCSEQAANQCQMGLPSEHDSAEGSSPSSRSLDNDIPQHHGDLIDEHAQPLRKPHRVVNSRARASSTAGHPKAFGPHSGGNDRCQGSASRHNQHIATSPPPPAVLRRHSSADGHCAGRNNAMTAWRIVRPSRPPTSGSSK